MDLGRDHLIYSEYYATRSLFAFFCFCNGLGQHGRLGERACIEYRNQAVFLELDSDVLERFEIFRGKVRFALLVVKHFELCLLNHRPRLAWLLFSNQKHLLGLFKLVNNFDDRADAEISGFGVLSV